MDDESSCHISHSQSSNLQKLSLKDLREITNDFSDERLLGQGGFGRVYKGVQQNGDIIAVKKLTWSMTGIQDKQYDNEARHLMRLKHPNIVQLLGYCSETEKELVLHNGKYVYAEKSERLLCLEYLSKGSLREHLSDESSGLDWDTRYKIIKGICCGLHYLHEEWESTPIIHRDLKPANILVDDNMVPKIADFGLSRLFGEEQTRTCTRSCDGTPGYMAPEYINRGIITKKLDIFSLGVIIIEIMTGHRDYPDETQASSELFIELVLKNWRDRMEKALGYTPRKTQCQQIRRCIQIGLQCVTLDRTKRPTTGQIMKMLHGSEAVDCSNERQIPEELWQEINQAGTAGKADEGLPTNETKGKNTRFQLRFLNKLKRPIYCHRNILSEIDTPIEIGIFDYDAMIIHGPLSKVKVEILALEGDFPYNPLNSWTAFEFNKHIAHSWDGKGNVLVGEGTTAHLRNGKCYLGHIQFREDSSWSRGASFIIGARVYNGEATGFRIQEAVMDPVFVQDGSLCLSLFPQPEQIELSRKYPGPSSSFDDYYSMHNQGAGAVGVQAVSRNVNGAAPEFNIPHWWSQLKVHGLRPSMPVDDMVNHLGNCISEQITSGIPELASNEVPTKETLEEIAQYLLGDVQGPPVSASDERSLMARVDSLSCLIQKDAGMSGLGMPGA